MNADNLELPDGALHAWKTEGMRITVAYSVNYDGFVARFDTLFNGNQYNVAYRLADDVGDAACKERAQALVPIALKAWEDNAWSRGRMIFFANDPRL